MTYIRVNNLKIITMTKKEEYKIYNYKIIKKIILTINNNNRGVVEIVK